MLLLGFANQKTVSGDEDLAKDLHVQDQPETNSLGMPARVGYIFCGVPCKGKWRPL